MRRALAAAALLLLVSVAPARAEPPSAPVYDGQGRLIQTPFAPIAQQQDLTAAKVEALFFAAPR